jgi:IclR family KDG regulon transcriptional repressor
MELNHLWTNVPLDGTKHLIMAIESEVRALSRGLLILEILAAHSQGLSLSAIARKSGLAKSSTHRLLQTLLINGYVRRDARNSDHYLPSFKLLTLSSQLIQDTDFVVIAHPHLEVLAKETGETVHLVLLDHDQAVYVAKVESPNPIRMYSQIGHRAPLHCTGVGKAILAFLPRERQNAVLKGDLPRHTDHTLTDPGELRAELDHIRRQGYAIDNGEHEDNVLCIAMPLQSRAGQVVGAVSIAAVSYRVDLPTLESWQPLLLEHVNQMNTEMAHYLDCYC